MPIDNGTAKFESKDGDTADIPVARVVPIVRQADGTAEDVSAAKPLPVAPSAADDTATLTEKVPTKLAAVTVATASTAVTLANNNTFATDLYLQAKLVAADNTGNLFVGSAALDQGVGEEFELAPGDTFEWHARPGTKFDINDFYIDADQGSNVAGVVGMYVPA